MKSVLFAKNTQDLLAQLKNNQGLVVVGGCTGIEALPEKAISVHGIKELSKIKNMQDKKKISNTGHFSFSKAPTKL